MNTPNRSMWLVTSLTMLVACTRQESLREIDWAKSALARNPQFEIIATDETAGVFTVRDTTSGSVRTLRLADLIAGPLPPEEKSEPAPAVAEPAAAPEEAPEEALAADQTTPFPELPGIGAEAPASGAIAEGPGFRITRGANEPAEPASPATLEGPGYRIEKQGIESGNDSERAALADAERRTDPIICQGNRQMHIDGETIEFSGDAIIAERGCDLYITNARIRAGGVGIIARQQARVHIVNSTIGGTRGSYEASDGGEIYVTRSTFEGVGRRFEGGLMTDLGGNRYSSR